MNTLITNEQLAQSIEFCQRVEESVMTGPTGLPHCLVCGVLWTEHERDTEIGPMGVRAWVCRLPEEKFNALLEFMEDESNW